MGTDGGVFFDCRRVGPDGVSWGRSLLNMELDANLSQWAGPGHWNNPGLLISTKNDGPTAPAPGEGAPRRISEVQVRSQFSMFVVLASPLIISGSVIQIITAKTARI